MCVHLKELVGWSFGQAASRPVGTATSGENLIFGTFRQLLTK